MLLVAPGSAAYLVGGISLLTRSGGGLAWVVGGLVGGLVGAVLPASPLAATAEQHALEEVLVDDVTGAAARALIGNLLDALEQRSVNDRVVPTRVERPGAPGRRCSTGSPGSAAAASAGRLGREAFRRSGPQAEVGHGLRQPVEAVVTAGVDLEGLADQRGALGVDGHTGGKSALEVLAD